MAFIKSNEFIWNEPWFFQQRIRAASSWFFLSFFLSLVAVGVAATLWLTAAGNAPPGSMILTLSLGTAASVWWVLDGTETRRRAILYKDRLVVGGDMGKYSTPTTFHLQKIPVAVIVLPEESHWPAPGLYFVYEDQEQAIGIDQSVSLPRLAQAIHNVGIPVRLEGWQPGQGNEFVETFQWQAIDGSVRATATMQPIGTDEAALFGVKEFIGAVFRQCWPFFAWLAITIPAAYYAYQNWNAIGWVTLVGFVFIPLAVLFVAVQLTERFATASAHAYLSAAAKSSMRKREGLQLDVDDPNLISIQVREPEEMPKRIFKIREEGFVQADEGSNRLWFEGKKERWSIPSDSVESVAIEEVQLGTPGQDSLGMLVYFVVIEFVTQQGNQKLSWFNDARDYGEHNEVKQAEYAVLLYERIAAILPAGG